MSALKFKTIGVPQPGTLIEGFYGGDHGGDFGAVSVDGKKLPLKPSLKVANHSPTGFAWGYSGSGPTQLALAILLNAKVPAQMANTLAPRFRNQFIAPLKRDSFAFRVDITKWVDEQIALAGAEGHIV